jgi:lipopolysaccharide transport system permease protein
MDIMRTRYAGSVIGIGWFILGPLLMMGVYSLVYTYVFRVQPPDLSSFDYVIYILAGLVPYMAFGQALASGASALTVNRALMLNKVFPAELIPAREVFAASASLGVGCVIILLLKILAGEVHLSWIFLPVILVLFLMMTLGITWFFALANIATKDTTQIISFILMILIIASPIAYTPQMVPSSIKIIMYLNPLAYFIQAFQNVLVLGVLPDREIMIGCFCIGLFSFHLFYKLFVISKRLIADSI